MSNPISYKGKIYPSLKKLVESEASDGLTYANVATRVRDGWDLEKALCEPKNKNSRKIWVIDRKEFTNLKDLAKEAGISYEAAVKRSHRGWSDEEIFYGRTKQKNEKVVEPKKARGKSVCVEGEEYQNLRHAFDSIGPSCTFNTVRARLRYGWSLEEALEVEQKVDGRKKEITSFTSLLEGKNYLFKITEKYNLCQKINGLYDTKNSCFQYDLKQCYGACIDKETPEEYNARVNQFIEENTFSKNNMVIVDRGRTHDERSAIVIQNGQLTGYCFYDLNYQINKLEILQKIIIPLQNNRDSKNIIQGYLRKHKVMKVIPF